MYSKAIEEYEDQSVSLEQELKSSIHYNYKIEDEIESTNHKIFELKDSINDIMNGKRIVYFKEGFNNNETNDCDGDHYVQIRYLNNL